MVDTHAVPPFGQGTVIVGNTGVARGGGQVANGFTRPGRYFQGAELVN